MAETHNLDYLTTATFISNDEDDGKDLIEKISSVEFNKIFLDPFKTYLINTAGRLKPADDQNQNEFNIRFAEFRISSADAIESYIKMNLRDALMSTASAFLDDLKSLFVTQDVEEYEDHYEFAFPYDMLTKEGSDIINNIFNIDYIYTILDIIDYNQDNEKHVKKGEAPEQDNDLTVQIAVGNMFDRIYSYLMYEYFDRIIVQTVNFYISAKPEYAREFLRSYEGIDTELYTDPHGFNHFYSYLTISLRKLIKPHLDEFKICLFTMANTVSCMIMGTTDISKLDEEDKFTSFMKMNPFAYEAWEEATGKANEEKEEQVIDYDGNVEEGI